MGPWGSQHAVHEGGRVSFLCLGSSGRAGKEARKDGRKVNESGGFSLSDDETK